MVELKRRSAVGVAKPDGCVVVQMSLNKDLNKHAFYSRNSNRRQNNLPHEDKWSER